MERRKNGPRSDGENLEHPQTPYGEDFVGLEQVDPQDDLSEVPTRASEEPGRDTPADDAVLDQEELYEGLASESMPSGKIKES